MVFIGSVQKFHSSSSTEYLCSAAVRLFQNSLLVCECADRGNVRRERSQQCYVVLLFTLRPVTHKHTSVLAGDTAAHCLLLKDCSHESAA